MDYLILSLIMCSVALFLIFAQIFMRLFIALRKNIFAVQMSTLSEIYGRNLAIIYLGTLCCLSSIFLILFSLYNIENASLMSYISIGLVFLFNVPLYLDVIAGRLASLYERGHFLHVFSGMIAMPGIIACNLLSGFKILKRFDFLFSGFLYNRKYGHLSSSTKLSGDFDITRKIIHLENVSVRELLIPLVHITSISRKDNIRQVIAEAHRSNTLNVIIHDKKMSNIVGYINISQIKSLSDNIKTANAIKKPVYVHENQNLDILCGKMMSEDSQLAVVVNEYGGALGVINRNDIFRYILNLENEPNRNSIIKLRKNTYVVDGIVEIDDLNRMLDLNFPKDDYETIGGLIIHEIKSLPVKGDKITFKGTKITVVDVSSKKINKVRLEL